MSQTKMRRRPPCRDFGGSAESARLGARIVEQGRAISALQADLFSDIAEFDRDEGWRGAGAVSMDAWLTEACGVSNGTARQWVKAASSLESLPHLSEAFAEGVLSLDAVAPLAAVATPASDADIARAAPDWTVKQVRELAAWSRGVADADAARRFEHRSFRFNDARRTIWAAFTDDDYAEMKSSLIGRVMGSAESSGASDPLEYVPLDQRLYDELLRLFRCSAGAGRERAERYRPRVVVHAPLELLMGIEHGGVAEIQGLGPVPAEVARRLACDAHITFSVERQDGSILDQGRVRRNPTPAQRIEIARRDKGCRFPSCSFVDFTQVHHVQHWTLGGRTDMDNLITLCGRHHNAVHELGWKMRGNADDVMTFTSPHGRTMRSAPSPAWRMRR
jgi:uncharacterized protein DUF222/HNH endonuclease